LLADETGAAGPFAKFQAHTGPEFLREAASQVYSVHGTIFPSDMPNATSMMWRQPVGVVGCISPWNAAMLLALRAVSFPIAYGNTVVLKTSEASSIAGGIMLAEVFEEAGFPAGVFNVITNGPGGSSAIGDVLTSDERVRRITFTGSTEIGRHLAIQCAEKLKKICLELGGNCPLIILADADVDYAVNAAAFGRFMHQGQVCMNTKRMIVERPIAEEFITKLTVKAQSLKYGDPREPETIIGPLINEAQLNKLVAQVEQARVQGARITTGGQSHGLVFEPTVLVMTEDMDIAHDEVFGPVANVIIADDDKDALRIANATNVGLSSGIITKDTLKAWDYAEKIEAGCCHINDSSLGDETHAPLGGMKDSGWGKNGLMALEEFTEVRWVTLQRKPRKFLF
jgi:acyl-CoA reductase-like NAD-dependent aldehyde dehydrogenase